MMLSNFYAGIASLLVAIIGYFLVREFNRKDKNEDTMNKYAYETAREMKALADKISEALSKLNEALTELQLSMEETRTWTVERFISRDEHDKAVALLLDSVKDQGKQFEKNMEWCAKGCPFKNKTGRVVIAEVDDGN